MTGHSRKFWPPRDKTAPKPSTRACDHPRCAQPGEFRAPKSRDHLTEYFWFCLDHVREYNQAWDYYAGLSQDEIETMVRLDTTWQRPTWPLGKLSGGRWKLDPERVKDSFGVFDEDMWEKPSDRPNGFSFANTPEGQAMRVMELTPPLSVDSLKARYKELCKLHHPDANNGDKDAEERFKQIGQAYQTLMDCLSA